MIALLVGVILGIWSQSAAPAVRSRPADIAFRVQMIDPGFSESVAVADFNKDGRLDILSAEHWYEAPSWTRHKVRDIAFNGSYIDNFSDLPVDVDGDGYTDIVQIAYFARRIVWLKNPGKPGAAWAETEIDAVGPTEFAFLVDLNNDGRALEVLPQFTGAAKAPLAWYEVNDGAFVKHVVSPQSYGHGIGAGDVNGDGRADILTPKGWLEAPADPRSSDWKMHAEFPELPSLGFLHVTDINGDRTPDIVTSAAHDYGVFWLEKTGGKWVKRMIDESWSQAHALTLADLNGDGRLDILTGKRYMAHNGRDPGEKEPLGIYWYESVQGTGGKLEWVRHVIDYGGRAGAGMQIPVADLDGDGDLDFAVGGKSGLFLFENQTRSPRGRPQPQR